MTYCVAWFIFIACGCYEEWNVKNLFPKGHVLTRNRLAVTVDTTCCNI